jgi:transcriptional regulator with XRE-family HTH domain
MNNTIYKLLQKEHVSGYDIFKTIFKDNLKSLREYAHMTQFQVAEKLNVPVSTYANWEQGRREPCIADIFKLLYVFDVTANDLFDCENFDM